MLPPKNATGSSLALLFLNVAGLSDAQPVASMQQVMEKMILKVMLLFEDAGLRNMNR